MSTTATDIAQATRDFLRRHAPFDRMSDEALAFVIERQQLVQFPKDATIVSAQSGPVAWLYVIRSGMVGRREDGARPDPDRTLRDGELFPVGSLSAGGATTKTFYAMQDTVCHALSRDDFLELRRRSPEFERYCTQAITETLKQSLESLYSQFSQRAAEQQTLTRTLGELVRREPIACPGTAPLREAVKRMAESKVRTIVVVDDADTPVGMFTLVDLLRRIVLAEKPLSTPVMEVMTVPIVTLPASATAYEAMNVMAEHGIRQIVVVENGRLFGVINERDLFALQRISMWQVIEAVRAADSVDKLKHAGEDIARLTQNLLAQGVGAEPLTRTIAALNDALGRRAIELALATKNLQGIEWCWLALGSEGRGEQTFATDQDNALLFTAADAREAEAHRRRLLAFATDVNRCLDALGFPLCTGNVMAGNPDLCLSVDEWKAKFLAWIREPTPQALLNANIVFDFRALYGQSMVCEALRQWLFGYTRANPVFLRLMVQNALDVEPPVGLIRAFVVDDEGPAKGTLDLKTRGTRIFVDCARVFALALGIAETGTAARLRLAGRSLRIEQKHVDATVEAFHFLQLLRLRQQDVLAGSGIHNRIDPYALHEIDQQMLKLAFREARQLQERLRISYRL